MTLGKIKLLAIVAIALVAIVPSFASASTYWYNSDTKSNWPSGSSPYWTQTVNEQKTITRYDSLANMMEWRNNHESGSTAAWYKWDTAGLQYYNYNGADYNYRLAGTMNMGQSLVTAGGVMARNDVTGGFNCNFQHCYGYGSLPYTYNSATSATNCKSFTST